MTDRPRMTRREFLATIGLAALSMAVLRIETLSSTITALIPDRAEGGSAAYGQSAYGA